MRATIVILSLMVPPHALAQDAWEATYAVQQGGRDIGRERVVLRAGQGGDKSRLELESRRSGSPESARAVLSRLPGGLLESLHLELKGESGTETIRATNQGSRIFITTTAGGARGGRELPGGPGILMLDDRVPGLLITVPDMLTGDEARLTGVSPRTGVRTGFTARRVEGGVELTGGLTGRITLDKAGRVERVTLSDGTTLTRLGG